ncbi:hypothetical protein PCE1_001574 [Barthelona sp. PCE]
MFQKFLDGIKEEKEHQRTVIEGHLPQLVQDFVGYNDCSYDNFYSPLLSYVVENHFAITDILNVMAVIFKILPFGVDKFAVLQVMLDFVEEKHISAFLMNFDIAEREVLESFTGSIELPESIYHFVHNTLGNLMVDPELTQEIFERACQFVLDCSLCMNFSFLSYISSRFDCTPEVVRKVMSIGNGKVEELINEDDSILFRARYYYVLNKLLAKLPLHTCLEDMKTLLKFDSIEETQTFFEECLVQKLLTGSYTVEDAITISGGSFSPFVPFNTIEDFEQLISFIDVVTDTIDGLDEKLKNMEAILE